MTKDRSYTVEFCRESSRLVGNISGDTQIRLEERFGSADLLDVLPTLAADLLRVALAVYAVDRLQRRQSRTAGGCRNIHLDVGVTEPDFWEDSATTRPLTQALRLLGSDEWILRFHNVEPSKRPLGLKFQKNHRICLYSTGLDSAAGLAKRLRDAREPVTAVTVWHQAHQGRRALHQLKAIATRYDVRVDPVLIRTALVKPPVFREQERTQRTRTFLFGAIAGAVACVDTASVVEMYENGVGIINLPLMHGMAVGPRSTKSSHPQCLRLMSEIVSRVAQRPIEFVLPHVERTKAELVRTLVEDGLVDVAHDTVSCVRYPVRSKAKQCGVCPACLGRRQAMIVGGIEEPSTSYEQDLFRADQSANEVEGRNYDYIKATLMHIDRLAELEQPHPPPWFLQYLLGTGAAETPDEIGKISDLLLRYRAEWLRLIALCQSRGLRWAKWFPRIDAA